MHLGIKNRTLVIALEPWAGPDDLGVSPQGCWHRHGTSPRLIVSGTHYIVTTSLLLHSKPHVPQSISTSTLRAQQEEWGSRTPCTGPKHRCWGWRCPWALHLLVLDEPEGQTGGSVGSSAGVLRVVASEVWAELVAGEEGSVPGRSNVRLVLSAPAAGDRPR